MSQITPRTIWPIQALRGIAAFAVVVCHAVLFLACEGHQSFLGSIRHFGELGASGVDIFFVVSGFIMVYISQGTTSEVSASSFMKQRLRRLVPLYWFFTFVTIALALIPLHHSLQNVSVPYALSSMFFVPMFMVTNPHTLMPLLPQGWTLLYEMFFYILFAVWLRFGKSRWLLPYLASALVAAVVLAVMLPHPVALNTLRDAASKSNGEHPFSALRAFFSNPVMLEFLLGALIARLFLRDRLPGKGAGIALVAASLTGFLSTLFFAFPASMRVIFWGIPAALLVAGVLCGTWQRNHIFEKLGSWSYSIYLSHMLLMRLALSAIQHHRLQRGIGDLFIVALCAGSVVAGWLTHKYIEMPMDRYFKNFRIPTWTLSPPVFRPVRRPLAMGRVR